MHPWGVDAHIVQIDEGLLEIENALFWISGKRTNNLSPAVLKNWKDSFKFSYQINIKS